MNSEFAKHSVHGGTKNSWEVCCLEVDDKHMGGRGSAHLDSMSDSVETIREVAPIDSRYGPSFFGGRRNTPKEGAKWTHDVFTVEKNWTVSKSNDHGAMLKATQPPRDEAGTAYTLHGSVSRATVKDLSDATRSVNRLKQTHHVGTLIKGRKNVKE